jgi:hypothetical protein
MRPLGRVRPHRVIFMVLLWGAACLIASAWIFAYVGEP